MPQINPDFLKSQMAAHQAMEVGDMIMQKQLKQASNAERNNRSGEPSQKTGSQRAVTGEGQRASDRKSGSANNRNSGSAGQNSAEQRYVAAMNAQRAQQTTAIPEWMWAGSQASARPRSPKTAWAGGFSESMLAARRPPRVYTAPPVEQWQPRGSSFYAYLRKEHPKKYSGKGKHSSYGGDVVCHPAEESTPIHVDRERDAQRKALEPGGGGEKFSGGESMADCLLRLREADAATRGFGKRGLESEGDYLNRMDQHRMFFASQAADRLGHQAPGHSLGAPGRWFKPAGPATQANGSAGTDMWGRPKRREGARAQAGQRWRWHAENV